MNLKYWMVLALVTMTLSMVTQTCLAAPFEHWTVHITNELQNGQTLFIHCRSKDDDLGERNLGPGTEFSWRFRVNLWQTTLYWCYMRNDNNHVALEVFWPETHSWLSYRCEGQGCFWSARDDGIYLKNIPENKLEQNAKWLPGW